jgi:hypothetical protein
MKTGMLVANDTLYNELGFDENEIVMNMKRLDL